LINIIDAFLLDKGVNMRKHLGSICALYPMPVVIVGAKDGDKENYTTVAHVGILNVGKPQYISIGLNKAHHINNCIKKAKAFSICLPNEDMVVETDYCGITSGNKTDKSNVFKAFYSEKPNAPMIEGCPVCMDCNLHDVLDFKTHEIFIGGILSTYAEDSVLTDGHIDMKKLRPMLFEMGSKQYWTVGEPIAKCWDVGKGYNSK
jgi:flavin reductase (DIM6/NTAB) family NADH-FMN oxidoreductase RutF